MNKIKTNDFYFKNDDSADTAIILLQMGGPYNLDLVEPFLFNLFSDPEIIRLPFFMKSLQKIIAKRIAKKRSHKVQLNYKQIGGKSPIFEHTSGLAKRIFNLIKDNGLDSIDVSICMRYSEPRADKIIEQLKKREIKYVVLFPLYPHFSHSTTGSSVNDFYKYAKKMNFKPDYIEIGDWGLEPFYLNWWINQLKEVLDNKESEFKIIFTAHGLPQRYIDKGDPYLKTLQPCTEKIMENFPNYDYQLAFQSKVGPVEWLRPYTTDAIKEMANGTNTNLIYVPIGFVSDHVETLQEIDILYKDQAIEAGFTNVKRVKVPNSSVNFAEGIVKFINSKLR